MPPALPMFSIFEITFACARAELYKALKRLLENPDILKRMGKKSWQYIQAYSIENEAKGFINAIKYACRHLT